MAFYVVTGRLGSGKSLVAVGKMRDYLLAGRRVATNLDLYLDALLPEQSRATAIRVPDKPRRVDLDALGTGDGRSLDKYDEQRFGLLVLDECASWLNSREWNDPERRGLLEWMLHARKRHWDVMLLIQDVETLDKQMRRSFCEHLVVCKRLDKLAIPGITTLSKILPGPEIRPPKMHVARVYYGQNEQAALADRWVYQGRRLYPGYRTGQVFSDDQLITRDGELVDMRAPYSVLSAWHLRGRYVERPSAWAQLCAAVELITRLPVWVAVHVVATLRGRSPREVARRWGVLRSSSPSSPAPAVAMHGRAA